MNEGKHHRRQLCSSCKNRYGITQHAFARSCDLLEFKKAHQELGSNWCIYPLYDWTHGESDYIEQILILCATLEFKPHRDFMIGF